MNKTIKKIMALGVGATMIIGTAAVATAQLSEYPSPFVKDGVFVGKIVIGENAAAIDTLGAIDIAASIQRNSVTNADIDINHNRAVDNGYLFSENDELIYGSTLSSITSKLDDTDMPELLKSGTIEADDGEEYEYDVDIEFPSTSTTKISANMKQHNLDDEYPVPLVYFDLGSGADRTFYNIVVDFRDSWDAEDFKNSETIELFGKEYTFDPNNKNNSKYLTLFGSDTTIMMGYGEKRTVIYDDKEYLIELLGGNSKESTAILRINSEARTMQEGDSRKLGGLPVYVKNVFVSNIGGDDISVQLFIGSDKMEIEYASAGGEVILNGEELESVTASITKTGTQNWEKIDKITFNVQPHKDDIDYILPTDEYVDPLFGSFKFHFVGASDMIDNKESLSFERTGKKMNIVFTPKGGLKDTVLTLAENNASYEDFWTGGTLQDLKEDSIFIYNENSGDPKKAVTHVLQISKIKDGNNTASNDFELEIKDLTFDKRYTLNKCKAIDSKIALYPMAASGKNNISFTTSSSCSGSEAEYIPVIYTDAGARIQFFNTTTTEIAHASDIPFETGYINVTEDVQDDSDTAETTSFMLRYRWDNVDKEYDLSVLDKGMASGPLDDDDDNDHYLTDFGTYIIEDKDDSGRYVKVYIPAKEINYNMYFLPADETVRVSQNIPGSSVLLNPVSVGMAILDSEANLGSKPYIVVGGPCANTVAAELMGNPSECTTGFTEGKAMIKLYSDKNALLVAGYSGHDTQGASRVLANYRDYGFSGTELEITTANLNSLSVKKLY